MKFGKFLKELSETSTADIASVDAKLDNNTRRSGKHKGKRCKTHKRYNCIECNPDYKENDE